MYQQCDRNEGCHYIVVFKIQECCRHSYCNSLHSVLHHVSEYTVLYFSETICLSLDPHKNSIFHLCLIPLWPKIDWICSYITSRDFHQKHFWRSQTVYISTATDNVLKHTNVIVGRGRNFSLCINCNIMFSVT